MSEGETDSTTLIEQIERQEGQLARLWAERREAEARLARTRARCNWLKRASEDGSSPAAQSSSDDGMLRIVAIGRWILREAVQHLGEFQEQHPSDPKLFMSVNVPAASSRRIVALAAELLRERPATGTG